MSFWHWLFYGVNGARPGYRSIINRWLFLHIVLGWGMSYLIVDSLRSIALSVILPLTGVLIGLCFAWAGNAVALLQATEIHSLAKVRGRGFEDYVYSYQLSILVILTTITLWGLSAFGIYTSKNGIAVTPSTYMFVRQVGRCCLLAVLSITIRECWGIVKFAQAKLLAQFEMRNLENSKKIIEKKL